MNFRDWFINEVQWEEDPSKYGFSDVSARCISIDEFVAGLNKQLERYQQSAKERERFPRHAELEPKRQLLPQYTASDIHGIVDPSKGKVTRETVMDFVDSITQMPNTIFDEGEKSKHSNELDPNVFTINTGIPALRAVVFDKAAQKFYSINTCKGAGSCIVDCFALKGFYVLSDGKNRKLHQRINLLVNEPEEYYRKALEELKAVAFREIPNGKILKIRWNDAGDWFSKTYYNIAMKITKDLKNIKLHLDMGEPSLFKTTRKKQKPIDFSDKILSYGYTKQGEYIELGKKHGMLMNFSLGAKQEELGKVDISKTKMSVIVPRDVFEGVFNKKTKDEPISYKVGMSKEALRQKVRLWAISKGHIDADEPLLFTDELVRMPESKNPFWRGGKKYNVLVMPSGDSDIGAYRHDVHYTFLMQH